MNGIGLAAKDPVIEVHVDSVECQLLVLRIVESFDHQVRRSDVLKWDKMYLCYQIE